MEEFNNRDLKIFNGAGFLLGLATAIVGGIVIYTLSDNFGAAISGVLPIGAAVGISLEQKFQKKEEVISTKKLVFLLGSFMLGFVVFVALYIISKTN